MIGFSEILSQLSQCIHELKLSYSDFELKTIDWKNIMFHKWNFIHLNKYIGTLICERSLKKSIDKFELLQVEKQPRILCLFSSVYVGFSYFCRLTVDMLQSNDLSRMKFLALCYFRSNFNISFLYELSISKKI